MTKTPFQEIKEAIDAQMGAFGEFTKTNSDLLDDMTARIETLEAKSTNPGKALLPGRQAKSEYCLLFEDWLKKPHDQDRRQKMANCAAGTKALSLGAGSTGEHAVPEEISREIERLELEFSPVRSLVKVERTMSGDYKKLLNERGAAAGWTDETTTRSESATSTFRQITPTFGELYAYPQTTEWAFDDVFFDAGAWLAEEVAQQFAVLEGAAVIDGDGTNKPTGMLNTDPVLTADFASPLRADAAYEYIACDTDTGNSPVEQAPGITGDCLIDTVYRLNSMYRAGASWIMNSSTTASVRKLKDSDGRYLWADGLLPGQPASLLGYPVATWEQMPDIAANAFPIGFGNFKRAYLLVDRTNLRITVDNNITTPGRIKFYVRRRVGGHVLNNDAAKFIRSLA